MRKPKEPTFASEAALCATFIGMLPSSWTAYAETAGWDILLVRAIDGFQIGIEAKLRLNAEVISQALEEYWHRDEGPNCRAVLVPYGHGASGFDRICHYLGLTIISVRAPRETDNPRLAKSAYYRADYEPKLPGEHPHHGTRETWHEWCPPHLHKLPDYVPDCAAGASGPVKLTDWKIRALKIAAILELRGVVTRNDFKTINLDHRRWMASGAGWLQPGPVGGYVKGKFWPAFDKQHPRNYEEIKADAAKWMPAASLLPLGQKKLAI